MSVMGEPCSEGGSIVEGVGRSFSGPALLQRLGERVVFLPILDNLLFLFREGDGVCYLEE